MHVPHSNFDDWKWSTEKRCICNKVTSLKIDTLNALYVSLKLVDKSQQIQPKDLTLASLLWSAPKSFWAGALKEHDFSDNVVVERTLINPLETKARPPIDHCLQCISGGEVAVVRGGSDLCNAAAA